MIYRKHKAFDVGLSFDRGDKRQNNEDSLLVKTCFVKGQEIGIFAVADGMGGHHNGDQASKLVIDVLSFWWDHYFLEMLMDHEPMKVILESLDRSIALANYQLNVQEKKSGTTLSLLLLIGDFYAIRHIGDSRIYLVQKRLTQLTQDHSYVQEMMRKGNLRSSEIAYQKKKNLITRCIGIKPSIELFKSEGKSSIEDIFLLCTDGFYGYTTEPDILRMMYNRRIFTMQDKAKELRKLIKPGDATDNVSILLVQQFYQQ